MSMSFDKQDKLIFKKTRKLVFLCLMTIGIYSNDDIPQIVLVPIVNLLGIMYFYDETTRMKILRLLVIATTLSNYDTTKTRTRLR